MNFLDLFIVIVWLFLSVDMLCHIADLNQGILMNLEKVTEMEKSRNRSKFF